MIKQPIEEYLKKHTEYIPNRNSDPRRAWNYSKTYNRQVELIKYDFQYNTYKIHYIPRQIFTRYMNNKRWKW